MATLWGMLVVVVVVLCFMGEEILGLGILLKVPNGSAGVSGGD